LQLTRFDIVPTRERDPVMRSPFEHHDVGIEQGRQLRRKQIEGGAEIGRIDDREGNLGQDLEGQWRQGHGGCSLRFRDILHEDRRILRAIAQPRSGGTILAATRRRRAVSQPIHADQDASPDPDPLLAFCTEQSDASGSLAGDAAASPENPAVIARSVQPAEPVEPPHQVSEELRLRVDRVERLAERSLLELTALKSDLATLVGAVEDIKKLQSRRDVAPARPTQPATRMSLRSVALAVVVLLSFATLGWGLATVVSEEVPEPAPIESEAEPVAAAPVVEVTPPPAEVQTATTVEVKKAATVSDTPTARARPAARDDAPPRAASRTPSGYVGTLSIDASPAGEVFVNRQSAGRTPLRLDKLCAGSHLIWIEREGYRRWTRVVAVAANRVSRVSATLDPIPR